MHRFTIGLIMLLLSCLACPQDNSSKPIAREVQQALAAAEDLMQQCELSRKAGRLTQAESQCRAAIQLINSAGFPAQGSTATLGIILYEQGSKRLGFVTLRDSFDGKYRGSSERELYLGRIALELKEYKTAREVVQNFRSGEGQRGAIASATIDYWPKENDPNTLRAIISFVEGSLCLDRQKIDKRIDCFLRADRLCPKNVAIGYALGLALYTKERYKEARPYLEFVSKHSSGNVQKFSYEKFITISADQK